MSRRLVNLTLDTLKELPHPCRDCVFWELDPVSAQAACTNGDPGLEKEAWVSQTLLEWGSCGKVVYVDSAPAGYVTYAPPSYVPRASAFPTAPASPDAVLLTTAHVVAAYAGSGLGRMLIQGAARDLVKRGFKAIEAFGDARYGEPSEEGPHHRGPCVAPADFFLAVGFKTARPHPRYPRLRLELRTALSWKSDVEYALEALLGTISRPAAGFTPATTPTGRLAWAGA
ncbi:MAG: GNAT family N-acetyltransferase [Micromonosporaceae bacterium]|jgi:hypothetical protein